MREAHVDLSLPGQRVRRVREDVAVDAGHGGEAFALLVRTLLGADVSGAVDGDSPVEKRLLEDDVSVHDADFGGAGAGRFRKIWHITLPAIKPTIMILLILALPGILGADFEEILLLQKPQILIFSIQRLNVEFPAQRLP